MIKNFKNQKGVTFPELLAVAFIFLLIAAAFFAFMSKKIEEAYETVDQTNQITLTQAAERYVLVHEFNGNVEENRMMIYIWQKDGEPSLEAFEGFIESDWPKLKRKEYLGVEVNRINQRNSEGRLSAIYSYSLIEKGR